MFKKNKTTENLVRKRIFYYPTIAILICVILVGFIGLEYTKSLLYNQIESENLNYANMTLSFIQEKNNTKDIIIKNIEEKLFFVSKIIFEDGFELNNENLKSLLLKYNVDEIYYYDPNGLLIYSASGDYLAWQAAVGDPIYSFMTSGKNVFHEDVRKGTETDEYYKFSYFKVDEGNFVQIGIHYDLYLKSTNLYDYQAIVEKIANDENVFYALITDINLVSLADSDLNDIGADWSDEAEYIEVLKGNSIVFEWYYEEIDDYVLETAIPLVIDGEIQGVLAIGRSLDSIKTLIKQTSIRTFVLLLLTLMILYLNTSMYIITPIKTLKTKLAGVNINTLGYQITVKDNDPFKGVYTIFNNLLLNIEMDLNKISAMESNMKYAAYHDELTGLMNRRALTEDLERVLNTEENGSICLFDLNNLKEINDIHGHVVGDEVLKTMADKIKSNEEVKNFYRFGGDEFVAIIVGDKSIVEQKSLEIMKLINQTQMANNFDFDLTCCVGISSFPQDGITSAELISKADVAMYQIKNNLRKGYAHFIPSMLDEVNKKIKTQNILKVALKENGFKLLYQPIIEVTSGNVVSFEALIRLREHNISPSDFIKVAQEKGLINEIGRYVIEEVVSQLYKWREKGIEIKPVAVNLSPNQIKDVELVSFIESLLSKHDIESKYLEIEITEDVLVENSSEAIEFLESLKDLGIKISLDDFGSGYSSLTYLTYLPIDKIKLDKVIIDKYLNSEFQSIINNIINIAHDLNLPVVAEGIEQKEQYDALLKINCDFFQEYLFSEPVDRETIEQLYLT